jgi:hypothetical protein
MRNPSPRLHRLALIMQTDAVVARLLAMSHDIRMSDELRFAERGLWRRLVEDLFIRLRLGLATNARVRTDA